MWPNTFYKRKCHLNKRYKKIKMCGVFVGNKEYNRMLVDLSLFIYFERDRDRAREGGAESEGERERPSSRLCTASAEPDVGLEFTKL